MRKEILILCFVLAVTFVSFFPALQAEFTSWDDRLHIVENPMIRSLDGAHIKTIFTDTASLGYIPLTILSFAIEHHFFGLNPFVFHLDNLILHLAVTALIFFFGLRLGLNGWTSGLAALLFGIHPMHVESVAWVTERKDVLYALFYLLALHSYLTYIKRCHPEHSEGSFVKDSSAFGLRMTIAEKGHKSFFVLTIVFGILSMLAKPMALSLPIILLICDWMKGRRLTANVFLEKIPHLMTVIPGALITYSFFGRKMIPDSIVEAALTWLWSMMFYLGKFMFPFPLKPLYALPEPVSLSNPVYVTVIFSAILLVFILIHFRTHRWLTFAWLFYFFSIFFLFRVDASALVIVADRYMYLPSAGFCFLFGFLIHQGLERLQEKRLRNIAMMCVVVLFTALSVKTFLQCGIWKNNVTLFSEMIRYKPDYAPAYEYRGVAFFRQGRMEEAFEDFSQAIKLDPAFAEGYSNRALIYSDRKQYEAALIDVNKALKLQPDFGNAYHNRGLIYGHMKQYDRALEDFNRAIVLNSSNGELYYCRSLARAYLNRFDEAVDDATKAQSLGYPIPEGYIEALRRNNVHG